MIGVSRHAVTSNPSPLTMPHSLSIYEHDDETKGVRRAARGGQAERSRRRRISAMTASPLDQVRGLWGGELPQFDSIDAVTRHGALEQAHAASGSQAPISADTETRAGVEHLPAYGVRRSSAPRAQSAVGVARHARRRTQRRVGRVPSQRLLLRSPSRFDICASLHEWMHAVILSCKRARRNMIPGPASMKPTLH